MNVVNTFTANQLFNANVTVDTNTLFVDSVNNRVGVGTSAPAFKLHVINDAPSTVPFSVRAAAAQTAPLALFQDSGDQFVASITSNGTLSTLGIVDVGSWAGTTDLPDVVTDPNGYTGLVVRRINSFTSVAGSVVARTDDLLLERDGTSGGMRITFTGAGTRALRCLVITDPGAVVSAVALNITLAGSLAVGTSGNVYLSCMFGDLAGQGHHTEVTIQRQGLTSSTWIGTLASTFNQ
jgi:hypothetical protein